MDQSSVVGRQNHETLDGQRPAASDQRPGCGLHWIAVTLPVLLHRIAWLACVIYSSIPSFWLVIHPRAEYWRSRLRSPYRVLAPIWFGMWVALGLITAPWRAVVFYRSGWEWAPAASLF